MKATLLLAALIVGTSLSAQAAQGVNPGQQPAARYVQGWVVAVRQGQAQGLGKGQGGAILQIRSGHRTSNVASGNAQAAAPVMKEFTLSANTHFEVARGTQRMPGNAGMLRPGQHVMVQAQGQQAVGVRIMAQSNHNGRRGAYYAGRGSHTNRGNRGSHMHLPKANKSSGTHMHHASLTRTASHSHPKSSAAKKGR